MNRWPIIILGLGVAVYCFSYFAGQHRGHILSGDRGVWEVRP